MDIKKRYESQKKELVKRWDKHIDKKIINAFLKVPREDFVLEEWKFRAYDDTPLPIPADQTISQPTTVMQMLQELKLKTGQKILEIGAGSGYNAALDDDDEAAIGGDPAGDISHAQLHPINCAGASTYM